jgi:hypothetical protein
METQHDPKNLAIVRAAMERQELVQSLRDTVAALHRCQSDTRTEVGHGAAVLADGAIKRAQNILAQTLDVPSEEG